jgi:hypothetical protein
VTEFPKLFEANPERGVLATGRLAHWHELLEEWCFVHERYCRLNNGDAIYWQIERSNLAALAGAAWRAGWAALEEFAQDKLAMRSRFIGRADLFMKSSTSEDYVEAKLVWCRDGVKSRIARTVENIKKACNDARALHRPRGTAIQRTGVVFAVPSFLGTGGQPPHKILASRIDALQSITLDATAWCFPKTARRLEWRGGIYPGVILLAKSVA